MVAVGGTSVGLGDEVAVGSSVSQGADVLVTAESPSLVVHALITKTIRRTAISRTEFCRDLKVVLNFTKGDITGLYYRRQYRII